MTDPYRTLDDEARALARDLLRASHGALGTLFDGAPMVTRVACLWVPGQGMTVLISDLSEHARALRDCPDCSLLVGEVGDRGDPLTHPRMTLIGRAARLDKSALRDAWYTARPKVKLYYDFTDFNVLGLVPTQALLNGGFGKAYRFVPSDLPD
ncbi:MAG: pyridoxamine 5'-phosphate oxidase family protein [Pseudomonadota bacterium]